MTTIVDCVKVTTYCVVVTQPTPQAAGQDPVARIVARRLPVLRERHGWSAQQLADRCAEAGWPELNRAIIANIESGRRRSISIDEVLLLAMVLDVTPVHLMDPEPESAGLPVGNQIIEPDFARPWLAGQALLSDQDPLIVLAGLAKDKLTQVLDLLQSGALRFTKDELLGELSKPEDGEVR